MFLLHANLVFYFPLFAPRFYSSPYSMSGDVKRQIEVSGWIEVKGHLISSLAREEPKTLQRLNGFGWRLRDPRRVKKIRATNNRNLVSEESFLLLIMFKHSTKKHL